VSCRAPLTFRLWSCSRSYNFVIKSGNFWTTQLVLRLITLLYDSLQLLYQSRGSQGCRRRGMNTYCSRLGRSLSAKYGMSYVSVSSSLNSSKVTWSSKLKMPDGPKSLLTISVTTGWGNDFLRLSIALSFKCFAQRTHVARGKKTQVKSLNSCEFLVWPKN
jgi:hypothetical protein